MPASRFDFSEPPTAVIVMSRNGMSVHVDVFDVGDKRKGLLILDGIGCSGWAFRRVIPELVAEYRVALMHYPGHGSSPLPSRPWMLGMHDLADVAADVIARLEFQRPTVLGFSMGFQVALELYKRHRDLVGALISVAGPSGHVLSSFQGTDVVGHILPLVRSATRHAEDWTGRIWRRVIPSKWLQWIGLQTQLNAERIEVDDIELYLAQIARMSPELFVDMLGEAAHHSSDDILPRIRVPSLVIAGGRDRFVSLPTMQEVASRIPHSRCVVIPEASHALPAEFPMELAEHVLTFGQTRPGVPP